MPNREFAELQQRLRALWPSVTLRSIGDVERTVVVVHSISMDVPDQLIPVFPAYEERFLCLVLSLLRSQRLARDLRHLAADPAAADRLLLRPRARAGHARGAQPLLGRLARRRPQPAADEEAARTRPGAIERIRALVAQPELAFLLPFATSRDEVELAVRLGIPLYGADPALEWLGTKSGSRRVFAEEGVPHAYGFDVAGERDVLRALRELRSGTAVLKLDRGVSGLGNALVDVAQGARRRPARPELSSSRTPKPPSPTTWPRSPTRAGSSRSGSRATTFAARAHSSASALPARSTSSPRTTRSSAGRTARRTSAAASRPTRSTRRRSRSKRSRSDAGWRVKGRSGAVRSTSWPSASDDDWQPYAIEINLRCGGTTHPFMAISTLTDGIYDPLAGEFRTRLGDIKHYVATDHLDAPAYQALTPDDLLDVVAERSLGWDAERETGVALHMVSALAVAGRIGLTAIGDSPSEAQRALPGAEADARRRRGEGVRL